ncbi:MAG: ankyrin repeat domain-containing protein [Paracoccaceae bacterium]
MSDKSPDPQDPLAMLAAHEAELDKMFSEIGLPPLDLEMDEATAVAAFESKLPPIMKAAMIETIAERHATMRKLVVEGADLDATDPFGTTALDAMFRACDPAGMLILIEAGADASGFAFDSVHMAVLHGNFAGANEPLAKDIRGRSPFLLACRLGQTEIVRAFLSADLETCLADRTDDQDDALVLAMSSGNSETVDLLLLHEFGGDEPDEFGATPLYHAVEMNDLVAAEALLKRGALLDVRYNLSASLAQNQSWMMSKIASVTAKMMPPDIEDSISTLYDVTYTPEMVKLLISYGANPALFDRETFASAIGADNLPERAVSREDFTMNHEPFYGTANPEKVDVPFWHEQIRTNRSGYAATVDVMGKDAHFDEPVWSFDRFGRTGTVLPDGRLVLIAGEHEDSYDSDFHIYNDVTVMHPSGGMDHYIYPRDVFPPTDFHTATLVDDVIWIIGALGYQGQRHHDQTQVLRLDLANFSIHQVETTGSNPGWINRHTAVLEGQHIIVSGGKVEPGYVAQDGTHVLDLETRAWRRAD